MTASPDAPLGSLASKADLVSMLSGRGIEIGALHRPTVAPHLEVTYVDRIATADMIAKHPELADANPPIVDVVDDGGVLAKIPDASQDFVIASHLIEHLRDPISGLWNWQRVLKPGGRLFLVVPDKEQTFDKPRPVTELEHLLEDHAEPSTDRDYGHFREFALEVSVRQYDAAREDQAEEFAQHLVDIDYDIHFHVWDLPAFRRFLGAVIERKPLQMKVLAETGVIPEEFAFVLEKHA